MAVQSYAPNMRFAASFLDLYNKDTHHAVPDEVMMDKRTGQLVYKRNTDGKLIYYSQENFHLNNYIRQLKVLIQNNKKIYVRPNTSNCRFTNDTYFTSYNIEMIDWKFDENYPDKLIEGGVLKNNAPEPHSFIQETNGFFFQLNGRPRDRALVSFLSSIYDNYYGNYSGKDPDILAVKQQYTNLYGYDRSHAVVNYTVSYYDSDGRVVSESTNDGYVRTNELSFIPFIYRGIYDRDVVANAKIRINSVSMPKLKEALNLITTPSRDVLLKAVTDNVDLAFISCNVSLFLCTEDRDFTMPSTENTIPMLAMGWDEFEKELLNAREGAASSGIIISEDEPDVTEWEDITLWGEIIRRTNNDGSSEETDHRTDIDGLEKGINDTQINDGYFTPDYKDAEGWYIGPEPPSIPSL